MNNQLKQGLYQHFKGSYYRVINVARHSETEEELVIYQALYGERGFWARPIDMFAEEVQHERESVKRFSYVKDQTLLEALLG